MYITSNKTFSADGLVELCDSCAKLEGYTVITLDATTKKQAIEEFKAFIVGKKI